MQLAAYSDSWAFSSVVKTNCSGQKVIKRLVRATLLLDFRPDRLIKQFPQKIETHPTGPAILNMAKQAMPVAKKRLTENRTRPPTRL